MVRQVKIDDVFFRIKHGKLIDILLILGADPLLIDEGEDGDAAHLGDHVGVLVGARLKEPPEVLPVRFVASILEAEVLDSYSTAILVLQLEVAFCLLVL